MTRTEFIAAVAPVAVKVRGDGGPLFPSVSIAQAILETGGRIPSWNKIVGYKVGSGSRTPYWRGTCVRKNTWEMYDGQIVQTAADFRAYDNIEDCLKDKDDAHGLGNRFRAYRSAIVSRRGGLLVFGIYPEKNAAGARLDDRVFCDAGRYFIYDWAAGDFDSLRHSRLTLRCVCRLRASGCQTVEGTGVMLKTSLLEPPRPSIRVANR